MHTSNHTSNMVKANCEVVGVSVKSHADDHLGKVKDLMLDKTTGHVAYVVLDSGSFLGLGGKLFALPWSVLHYNKEKECFTVDMDKERFKGAPGFDKDNWPDMADGTFGRDLARYYNTKPHGE